MMNDATAMGRSEPVKSTTEEGVSMSARHPIPDDVLIDHLAVLAKTGAGKTYMAKGIVERLLSQKRRVCIVDPKNAWWGLKSSADGKSPAYPIVVFGGPKADVPLLAAHGKVLGEAVATTHLSCIICTKGMPEGERIRFLTDFFQTLDMKNTQPLHLVLDEAHMMAPQKPLGEMQRLTHWTSELVSGGRGMGFRIILLSQRPARLNKDVLTQCESLVAMRMTGPQDRDAVRAWIYDQADVDKGKEIVASLPTLANGEGWFWAPAKDILKRVRFPLIGTYDNSKTTRDSKADDRAALAPVDLSALQNKLGAVKAEIEANDPKALKAQVAELQKQLRAKPQAAPVQDLTHERSVAYNAGWAAAMKESAKAVGATTKAFSAIRGALAKVQSLIPDAPDAGQSVIPVAPAPVQRVATVAVRPVQNRSPAPQPVSDERVAGPMQAIIDGIAWWEAVGNDQPTRAQVAAAANRSSKSSSWETYLSRAKSQGLINYPTSGCLALTEHGRSLANVPGEPPSTDDLHSRVRSIIGGPEWKILSALIAEYPKAISVDEVGAAASVSCKSSSFETYMSRLKGLSLVAYPAPGMRQAAEWLFI